MNKNILVLDDDINILNIIKKYLIKLEFNPIISDDPKNFLKKFKLLSPEVLIIDLVLRNNQNGFEVINEIRRIDNYVTIIAISGYSDKDNITRAMEAGATFFLSKPFNFDKFKEIFAKIRLQRQYIDMTSIETRFIEYEKRIVVLNNDIYSIHPVINQLLFLFKKDLKDDLEKIRVGLFEALMNAIEHGNLGIDYKTKQNALKNDNFDDLLIQKFLNDEILNKKVTITMEFNKKEHILSFEIEDEGDGFDWQKYSDNFDITNECFNGRGIKIMKYAFDDIIYNTKGNKVKLIKKINVKEETMIINKEKNGEELIIKINGEIDNSQAEVLKKHFLEIAHEVNDGKVILDFSGVSFIGSSGIGKLLSLYKTLNLKDIDIEIININDDIYTLFTSFRLDKLFILRKK